MPARKFTFLSPFYGYSAQLIASWCCVSVKTARAYKNGSKRPSKAALRLFRLHQQRRVLTDDWEGWQITPEGIIDPEGKCTTMPQLHAYWIIMQYAAELARDQDMSPTLEGLRALLYRRA